MCLGPSNDPMWEDSRSIYIGVTAVQILFHTFPRESPCSHEVRATVASKFEVFNSNADNEKILRIGTSSHYNDFESLVNDIVEFSSLRESGGLEEPRQCASWLAFSTKGSLESAHHQQVETTKAISAV